MDGWVQHGVVREAFPGIFTECECLPLPTRCCFPSLCFIFTLLVLAAIIYVV